MNSKKDRLEEVININGSKVFIENGKVKTILNETIQKEGYMSVEEARQIGHIIIKKEYEIE